MSRFNFVKVLDVNHDFLIFFDNVRVDRYVLNWGVTLSCNGAKGTAYIQMLYAPSLDKFHTIYDDDSYEDLDSILDMTNVRIFVKNVFNNTFNIVFEGNIRSKSVDMSPTRQTITYNATDYTDWLDRIIAPLALPFVDTLSYDIMNFKWNAHGIDTSKTDNITANEEISMAGKDFRDYIYGVLLPKTLENNAFFKDDDTTLYFDSAISRIDVMGDISSSTKGTNIIDMVISTNIENVNSWYKNINAVLAPLGFELYQDRDGVIRIKPSFMNQEVLRSHVIDPALILGYTSSVRFGDRTTRVVASGGLSYYEQQNGAYYAGNETPTGAFIGNMRDADLAVWSTFRDYSPSEQSTFKE